MRPQRSKAWIVVIIAVIILIGIVSYLYNNRGTIFSTKDAENITKTFSPLLGSSKKKDTVEPSNTPSSTNTNTSGSTNTTGTPTTNTDTGGFTTGDGFTTGSGLGAGDGFGTTNNNNTTGGFGATTSYTPPLVSLPTPGTGTTTPPVTTPPTVTTPPIRTTPPNPNFCPTDDPLVFTDAEKEELASLLRQYYLIAPTIKTNDDLALVNNDIISNQALLDQVGTLTNQCMTQKSSLGYSGPQATRNNPYYSDPTNNGLTPYIVEFSQLEEIFKIW